MSRSHVTVPTPFPPQLTFNDSCATILRRQRSPFSTAKVPFLPAVVASPVGLLWTPHTIVDDLVPSGEHPSFTSHFEKFEVASDGTVSWEHQADYKVKCAMDFRDMPYDVQHMRLLSVQSTLGVELVPPIGFDMETLYNDPQLLLAMSSAEWECTKISEVRGVDLGLREEFPYIDLHFTLRRKPGWYSSHVVVPTIVLIVISWSSFFISQAAVPARVALGIICYLTLNNLASSVAQQLPKTDGYVRLTSLLDTSKFFVLYTIVE